MGLALADEFKLIVRDQAHQRLGHRPKQAGRASLDNNLQ